MLIFVKKMSKHPYAHINHNNKQKILSIELNYDLIKKPIAFFN